MKKKLLLTLLMVPSLAFAGKLHKLHFTKTNFGVYEDLTVAPASETSSYLGQTDTLLTNTQTNYNGHNWYIETTGASATTARIYKDGMLLDYLHTQDFGPYQYFDMDGHYVFCIDHAGQGWLVTVWVDGDNNSYLWKLDIETGYCHFVSVVDLGDANEATGGYMIEAP